MKHLRNLIKDRDGAVTVEYAIVAALISLGGLKSIHCITVYCLVPLFQGASKGLGG